MSFFYFILYNFGCFSTCNIGLNFCNRILPAQIKYFKRSQNCKSSTKSKFYQLGFQFAIDDFGTGFSSFNYLYRIPAHKIKIDRSFITGLPANQANAEIIKSMIAMLHSLGKTVVAEGAETDTEIEYLKKEKCDIVQGYYYYKPMPADEFISLIAKSTLKRKQDE